MRDVSGVISIVIQNLLAVQEDNEYDKKVEIFTFNTGEARC